MTVETSPKMLLEAVEVSGSATMVSLPDKEQWDLLHGGLRSPTMPSTLAMMGRTRAMVCLPR